MESIHYEWVCLMDGKKHTPQMESNTSSRAHYRAYAVAVRAVKKKFFSTSIASFRMVQGLVLPGPKKDLVPPSMARCDDCAQHFKEKIAQIRHKLDSTSDSDPLGEVPLYPSGQILLDEFHLLRPDDVDKGERQGECIPIGSPGPLSSFRYHQPNLPDRLLGLGVGGTAWQWSRSYLAGRFQKVVLGDFGSAPWQLCHGVPQGSILSPLLFNIFMKLLGEVLRRCGLRNHQYAVDTQLYLSFSTDPGEAVAVLNRCLAEVMGWMRAIKLKLNPDKTEVLLVGGSSSWVGDLDLVLNGVALPLKDRVHSLGVLLDPELSLEAQVTAVARSAFLQLRLIHQLRPYLEDNCLATVTHALVTSRLDFCNALYVRLPLKTVRILQMVQNRAARLRMGTGHYSHITPVLYQLHWLPIKVRAQFKVLVITYKALNSLGPGYLKERLRPYLPSCPLRSAAEALLWEPSVKDIRRLNTRRRAFSAVAPHLWNVLPGEVHLAPSLFVYRRQAKTFVFKQYFNNF
ncbi:putative RNA-directed DNA polymerase from transposon BS [Varanus komodoensis]|nr:putative RNA-directed DNA polymerase from transposon BS [Varanus komodoensis]